jgi:hypothetical protein
MRIFFFFSILKSLIINEIHSNAFEIEISESRDLFHFESFG